METQAMREARRWLGDRGVAETADGWTDTAKPDRPLTANDIAHAWADEVFTDEDLDESAAVRMAFALLDLLDDYWVTCEIRFADGGPDGPLPAGPLWDGYRRRLEAERDAEPVEYSLWVDWFEDRTTTATAFAEVLGNDITTIVTTPTPPTLRRASRVLECSGPVPWDVKHATYTTAARLPALHEPLFKALRAGYHDIYGDLDPPAALTLLTHLTLPPDTEHLTQLRTVLSAGHRNHRHNPDAWAAAAH
ncbi:hypothetical protein [Streptomyces sp. NBC_00091]|uniref:hypothetical protein n=1 Tax=Streptomyces sp. NBC_00091 TaxID=2975648 RepID=UPI0022538981|nr:hypothetical protein [Streptomyces sp. NBC_00091]MCX5377695.1 hypothetical protein [Streptomyces sp. NBC_00091]